MMITPERATDAMMRDYDLSKDGKIDYQERGKILFFNIQSSTILKFLVLSAALLLTSCQVPINHIYIKNDSSFTLVGLHFAATKERVDADTIGAGQWGNNIAGEGEWAVLPGLSCSVNKPFDSPWEQRFLYIKAIPKIGMPVISKKPYPIKAGQVYKFSFDGKEFRQSHDH